MANTLLKVSGLKVSYGGIKAVKGIDFEVRENELVTLIGSRGSTAVSVTDATPQQPIASATRSAREASSGRAQPTDIIGSGSAAAEVAKWPRARRGAGNGGCTSTIAPALPAGSGSRTAASLRSRAVCCFTRARAVRTKAAAHGWQRDGKRFARPPQQLSLFDQRNVGSPLAGDVGNKEEQGT
jgi:hypothetical protein